MAYDREYFARTIALKPDAMEPVWREVLSKTKFKNAHVLEIYAAICDEDGSLWNKNGRVELNFVGVEMIDSDGYIFPNGTVSKVNFTKLERAAKKAGLYERPLDIDLRDLSDLPQSAFGSVFEMRVGEFEIEKYCKIFGLNYIEAGDYLLAHMAGQHLSKNAKKIDMEFVKKDFSYRDYLRSLSEKIIPSLPLFSWGG